MCQRSLQQVKYYAPLKLNGRHGKLTTYERRIEKIISIAWNEINAIHCIALLLIWPKLRVARKQLQERLKSWVKFLPGGSYGKWHECTQQHCSLAGSQISWNSLYICKIKRIQKSFGEKKDMLGVWKRKLGVYGASSKQWRPVVLLSPGPTVSVSGVELQGQRKPPILCWKEMIIYHLVIHRDWVTRLTQRKAQRHQGRVG